MFVFAMLAFGFFVWTLVLITVFRDFAANFLFALVWFDGSCFTSFVVLCCLLNLACVLVGVVCHLFGVLVVCWRLCGL